MVGASVAAAVEVRVRVAEGAVVTVAAPVGTVLAVGAALAVDSGAGAAVGDTRPQPVGQKNSVMKTSRAGKDFFIVKSLIRLEMIAFPGHLIGIESLLQVYSAWNKVVAFAPNMKYWWF